jgi:hypothetical protein
MYQTSYKIRYLSLAILGVSISSSMYAVAADIEQRVSCVTSEVTEAGTRHDCCAPSRTTCPFECVDAPSDQIMIQGSFTAEVEASKTLGSEFYCSLRFENYREWVGQTAVMQPTRACVRGFVKSRGGVLHLRERGRIECVMRGKTASVQP